MGSKELNISLKSSISDICEDYNNYANQIENSIGKSHCVLWHEQCWDLSR